MDKQTIKTIKICPFCDRQNKTRCCIWNSYYKQHKGTDWDSERFNIFISYNIKGK